MKSKLFLSTVAVSMLFWVACGGAQQNDSSSSNNGNPEVTNKAEQYMGQAGMALSEGNTKEAIANYLSAAEIYESIGKVSIEAAEAHFLAADLAYQISERELALEEYQKAVNMYLQFTGNSRIKAANALNNMGTIHKEMQNKSKALNSWHRALELYQKAPAELRNESNVQKIQQNIRDLEAGF